MPKHSDTSQAAKVVDDKKNQAGTDTGQAQPGTQNVAPAALPKGVKEHEPEVEGLAKIQEIHKDADDIAEAEVKSALGEEARLAQHEPRIGPDLEDHGVKSPDAEASRVITEGSVLELPITDEEYKRAQHEKVTAHVDDKKDVLGVSSVIALALWIGRLLKKVHGHATRIMFKKPSSAKATEGEGGEDGSVGR